MFCVNVYTDLPRMRKVPPKYNSIYLIHLKLLFAYVSKFIGNDRTRTLTIALYFIKRFFIMLCICMRYNVYFYE